jgi:hypothetical protein
MQYYPLLFVGVNISLFLWEENEVFRSRVLRRIIELQTEAVR